MHHLNLSLTDTLRRYVERRTGDDDVYASPGDFICDLIRKDMEDEAVFRRIMRGVADFKQGRLSNKSILDIAEED